MTGRIREWLVALIAPCECIYRASDGRVFQWRERDARRCRRRGHHGGYEIVGFNESSAAAASTAVSEPGPHPRFDATVYGTADVSSASEGDTTTSPTHDRAGSPGATAVQSHT